MKKVIGIKSVDFKITAIGEGVVNWNGSTELKILVNGKYKKVNNHSLPKLRGYTNKVTKIGEDGNTYEDVKTPEEIDFSKTPLYISQNCIRHHLFKNEAFNLQDPEVAKNMDKLLCSLTGLVRGYVIAKKEYKRTSALLITDFNETEGNGNFEQMSRSGSKEKEKTKSGDDKSTSMFSKTTFGDTKYEAYASLSIEQLQFISLDEQFSRQSMDVNNEEEAKKVASKLSEYLQEISKESKAEAVYHKNYVRKGTVFNNEKHGEAGILLNDAAIDVVVGEVKYLLESLSIRQAKGYMYVDTVDVDYNNSTSAKNMFRIKRNFDDIEVGKNSKYAVYFEGV